MRKTWRKIFGTAALAFVLCLCVQVFSGHAFNQTQIPQQCVEHQDGTVTDNSNRVTWQTATGGPMAWHQASESYVNSIQGLGGHTDWRLPTKNELQQLYSSGGCKSLMKVTGSGGYWSSTTSSDGTKAYSVDSSGNVSLVTTDDINFVRAVRTYIIAPLPRAW